MKRYAHIDELLKLWDERRIAIRKRLREYGGVPVEKYFYELCYCLMTPQASAVNAGKVQQKLENANFFSSDFDPTPILFHKEHYIRFHKTKGKWLLRMKEQFSEIEKIVLSHHTPFEKRELLAANVLGLSYKEATHFLRNIGRNGDLTILDRHILKNLNYHSILQTFPKTLTRKKYLSIEKKFQMFANEIGISVNELDLLFWSKETGKILK